MATVDVMNKIVLFLKTSFQYAGDEISIASGQYFEMDELVEEDAELDFSKKIHRFVIQYGFPQSGCIYVDFQLDTERNHMTISEVSVYAPPVGSEVTMADFRPVSNTDGFIVAAHFGLDCGTVQHSGLQAISENENALKIIDIATEDLKGATIIGDCDHIVSSDNGRFPLCCSLSFPNMWENSSDDEMGFEKKKE